MKSLSDVQKYAKKHHLIVSTCRAGRPIFKEGNPVFGIYYVLENKVKIVKRRKNEKDIFLWCASPNEWIGLTSYFQKDGIYMHSAIAGSLDCKYIFLTKDHFIKLLNQYPELKRKIHRMLCKRIKYIETRTEKTLPHFIDERIIEAIFILATKESKKVKADKIRNVRIQCTKQDLANIVGVSLEYLRSRLKAMKRDHLINYGRNWLILHDTENLKQKIVH